MRSRGRKREREAVIGEIKREEEGEGGSHRYTIMSH